MLKSRESFVLTFFFGGFQHIYIYVTYICFIFETKEWKDHIHLLFLHVFFCVDVFFRGKIHRKACAVSAASQVFTPRRFWKLRRSPCGLGDLGLGGFGMVGWLDVGCVFFLTGDGTFGMFFFWINFFFFGGVGDKIGRLVCCFFGVFDVCMSFLCISLKISELILWWWDCSSQAS